MLSEDLDEIEKLTASLSAMVDDEEKFKQSSNEILEHLSQDNTENISNYPHSIHVVSSLILDH